MTKNQCASHLLTIIVTMTLFCGVLTVFIPNEHLFASAANIPANHAAWTVSTKIRYDGGNCLLSGNLDIAPGGNMILNNLTLRLNNLNDDDYTITVENGGILRIFNSTIKSQTVHPSYFFENDGTLQIENSTIKDFGLAGDMEGIVLYDGTAILVNDTFTNNDFGLDFEGGFATSVRDDIFNNNLEAGIYIDYTAPTFYNITVQNTQNNGYAGIYDYNNGDGGNVAIHNSKITNNQPYGIYLSGSSMDLYNTVVTGNGGDVDADGGIASLYDCTYATGTVTAGSEIDSYFYYNISATWQSDKSPVVGGIYNITDMNNKVVETNVLDDNGQVFWHPIMEYKDTGNGKMTQGPFAFNVSGTRGQLNRANQTRADVPKDKWINLTLDDVPPVLKILSPKEGFATRNTTVLVSGITEPSAMLKAGSDLVPVFTDGTFSWVVNLAVEGQNNIRMWAYDAAGNMNDAQINITRDTATPSLTIDTPTEGALFNYTAIRVNGTTEIGAHVKVNGNPVVVTSQGKYSTVLNLKEGTDVINVTSTDTVGNTLGQAITVTIDLTPPNLNLQQPLDGFKTKDSSVLVSGTTEAKAVLTVNGILVPVAGTSFQTNFILKEGLNLVSVRSCDAAMNCARAAVNGTRHSTPPPLSITSPPTSDTALTNKDSYAINGSTLPDATLTIGTQNVKVSTDGTFSSVQLLKEGSNPFTITAVDTFGNLATLTRNILKDSVPPGLLITVPSSNNLRTNAGQVTIEGTTEAGATVTINGVNVAMTGTTFSKTFQMNKDGQSNYKVISMDKAGNMASYNLTVVRKTQLTLQVTAPTNGAHTQSENVTVEGVTEPGALVQVNEQNVNVSLTGKFKANVSLALGSNSINVTAGDDLKNLVTVNLVITRDAVPPPKKHTHNNGGVSSTALMLVGAVLVAAIVAGLIGFVGGRRKKKGDKEPEKVPQTPAATSPPPQEYYQGGAQSTNTTQQAYQAPASPLPPPPPPNYYNQNGGQRLVPPPH